MRHRRAAEVLVLLVGVTVTARGQGPTAPSPDTEAAIRANIAAGIGSRINASSIASLADAEAAASAFNAYLQERAGYSLSADTIGRLALTEWAARLKGAGTIPVSQLATVATQSFLTAMGLSSPPKSIGVPYFVVTVEKLNAARLLYRRYAPTVTASALPYDPGDLGPGSSLLAVQTAYPLEALVALYTCVSDDAGFGPTSLIQKWQEIRGHGFPEMSPARHPFGDHGWMASRPLSNMLTDQVVNQILDLAL